MLDLAINVLDEVVVGTVGILGLYVARTIIIEKIDNIMMKKINCIVAEKNEQIRLEKEESYNENWSMFFNKEIGDVQHDSILWKGDKNV